MEEGIPDQPKRSRSAFFIFFRTVRDDLKEDHPDARASDVFKVIAEKWRDMSEKEKKTTRQERIRPKQNTKETLKLIKQHWQGTVG